MKLFAGIDGGQSSTIALVADERGAVLGRGVAGPCDHIGQSSTSVRFARALEGALADALQKASLPRNSTFEAIVAGISGYEGTIVGVEPQLRTKRTCYVHDARIAHAAAFEFAPGIVVIAGTGSVAYGRNERGADALVGGWGFLFGDEGSAFALARRAVSSAMRAQNEDRRSPIAAEATAFFGVATLRALAHDFYTGKIDRAALAAFAQRVIVLAEEGERDAAALVEEAAAALADLSRTCALRLEYDGSDIGVALAGGTFASAFFRARVQQQIGALMPLADVRVLRDEPAKGALLLAYKEVEG
ncbi:MAG: BadF/BadG/BcrA/BcrD ATPase family protein [Vulcanimicrobiaceae bacterium]